MTSTVAACELLGASRATLYRRAHPKPRPRRARPAPPNALTEAERQQVLAVLRTPEFCDQAAGAGVGPLLDEGTYLCSISTMYRLLRAAGETRRAAPPGHPSGARSTGADRDRAEQVWSLGHHQAARARPAASTTSCT